MNKKLTLLVSAFIFSGTVFLNAANTFPSSGNAGIGTTSPSDLLHVEGGYGTGLKVGNGATSLAFRSYTGGLTGIPGSTFGMQITGPGASHIVMDVMANDGSDGFYVRIPTTLEADPTIDKVAFAVKANGFVGIGTSSPSSILEVYNSFKGQTGYISILPQDSTNEGGQLVLSGAASFSNWNMDSYQDDFRLFYGSNVHLRVDGTTGNVGVGTSTPNYKLDVLGTIRAEEIIVETGWSDFVFKDDYKLRSLDEVASFIEQQGHLPDIPSAAEVAEKGVTLGQMNSKLLQKVEELTLYSIDQEKQLETQQDQLTRQQQLIEQLITANQQLSTDVQTLKATFSSN